MKKFEDSLINYARKESLNELRKTDYIFFDHSIPIETLYNDGVIKNWGFNKCFFISLSQGLRKIYNFSAIDLMKFCWFTDRTNMFDTNIEMHKVSLEILVYLIDDIQIQIYIGYYKNSDNTWYTTQDYSEKYGNGKYIIRILNKGKHFELITSPNNMFIHDSKTMNKDVATSNQELVMKIIDIKNRLK